MRRLKYKLGTRSLASGEADFAGALAEPIGPLEQGFKNLIGIVLDTSRVQNAICAAAFMRRAFVEAQTFAEHRRAFGRRILEFPAIQRTLAHMRTLGCAALASTFRIQALSDRLEGAVGRDQLLAARRMTVNINKYGTAVACTDVVRSGIEVLGGNGTIEDFSVLPRLYRDSMVLESWEGTHNTLCAQVLRDIVQRGLHRPWLTEARESLQALRRPELETHRARALALHAEVAERITRLLSGDPSFAERHIRPVVDRMQMLASYLALAEELEAELERGPAAEKADIVELYRRTVVDPGDPMESPELGELERRVSSRL